MCLCVSVVAFLPITLNSVYVLQPHTNFKWFFFSFLFIFLLFENNREFVTRLRDTNKTVYLITGGFDCLIEPVADELGIPLDHMFANRLFFNFNGEFTQNLYFFFLSIFNNFYYVLDHFMIKLNRSLWFR